MRVALLWLAAAGIVAAQKTPKKLDIENVALSQYEDGPGVSGSYEFIPGQTIFFSFQISGYRVPDVEENAKVDLSYRMEATDASGVAIVEPKSGSITDTVRREDKEWKPKVRWTILIPPFAPGGEYRISMHVEDALAKTQASREIRFHVHGPNVEPSPTLAIKDLGFYRSDTDQRPLNPPAYRPGDAVWIRFDITGYKFGAKNAFDVGYGFTVLKPDGSVSFAQPDAAEEKDATFYPRRWVPAAFSLTLPPGVALGEYTLVLTARDKIGDQTAEARVSFTVQK
jgi:hypothetical protein